MGPNQKYCQKLRYLSKTDNSYNFNAIFLTVTNIFQFQLVLYHLCCTTIDALRSVVGPLPYAVCIVNIYVKNLAHINISLFSLAMTATKFAFVCIYKSIPIMEDNFLTTVIFATSNVISILAVAAKYQKFDVQIQDQDSAQSE